MKYPQFVQYAIACLQALDANEGRPLSLIDLSHGQGVPFPTCVRLIHRLKRAGIVDLSGGSVVLRRPVEELTAMEIVQAVGSTPDKQDSVRMLVGGARGRRSQITWDIVRSVDNAGLEGVCNG